MTLFCANKFTGELKQSLLSTSTPEKAQKMQRFFPTYIHCAGAMAGDIATVIKHFHAQNSDLSPQQVLLISETLLKDAQYSEEVLLAFGLLNKLVKKHFDDDLLNRFTYWLEHYTSNWAHVDDLCLKTVYNFLLSRTYLIEDIQQWNQNHRLGQYVQAKPQILLRLRYVAMCPTVGDVTDAHESSEKYQPMPT